MNKPEMDERFISVIIKLKAKIFNILVPQFHFSALRDWSLIMGGGGVTKRENRRSKTVCAPPPPKDRVKLFAKPPFKEWKLFAPPPPSIWLKLQATAYKLPYNFLCTPFSMAKKNVPPPLFIGVKLHMSPPPPPFCSPPPRK